MKGFLFTIIIAFFCASQCLADSYPKGDLNQDGKVSVADMALLISAIRNNDSYNSAFDLQGDKQVNFEDLAILEQLILQKINPTGLSGGIDNWEEGDSYKDELDDSDTTTRSKSNKTNYNSAGTSSK